ncbi:MAG: FtsX-like permease family protein [Chlamydiota bacterium]
MFEFKVAYKYLIPRKKSLSTALISLMSVLVISLVVWLVVVFLSVTTGIEKNWLRKLTSLHAPLRLTPTELYYSSYYYQIDRLAAASNYTLKTIGEKQASSITDPYAVDGDPEIPIYWPGPDLGLDRHLRDPVKTLYAELASLQKEFPDVAFQDYEIGGALLRLKINSKAGGGPSYLSQMSYLLSLTEENPHLRSLLVDPSLSEINQLLSLHPSLAKNIGPNGEALLDFDTLPENPPPWAFFVKGQCHLPSFSEETPILLPKNYRESGVLLGDSGTLSYVAPAAVSAQEQRIPIRVVGFYDPGILSVGNKCLIVPSEVTQTIHAASQTFSPDGTPTNGLFVWFKDLEQAEAIKEKLAMRLEHAGIAPYWKIATYQEFEFSKDLMFQFRSDRTLFMLIAAIILIVACCNVISLLVLLVNDKKKEIAILQSMGASFGSIAAIFGICGATMGSLSCLIGGGLAIFTLKHLDSLVAFLSALQGHAAFNPAFFGKTLPNQLSFDALLFVVIATPILSLLAGLIPALKASRIRPSSVLRSE